MKYKLKMNKRRLSAYAIAGSVFINNVPIETYAQNSAEVSQNDTVENEDESQIEVSQDKEEVSTEITEDTTNAITEASTEVTTEETNLTNDVVVEKLEVKNDNNPSITTEDISQTEAEVVSTTNVTIKEKDLMADVAPFTLYGENNPTKEVINDTNKDKIGKYDTNSDGVVTLAERLDWEIKNAIRKSNEPIGKNITLEAYKKYSVSGISDETQITVSEEIKNAASLSGTTVKYQDIKNIEKLDLSNKNLDKSKLKGLEYFTGLKELNLSGNKSLFTEQSSQQESTQESVLKPILTLKSLQKLNLSNTGLKSIKYGDFANLPSLVEIDLSNNAITKFENIKLEETSKLESINLKNNPIKTIENINIPSLKVFDTLFITTITNIKNVNLPNVTNFDVSYSKGLNRFELVNLDSISSLNLNSNNLEVIEKVSLKNAYRFFIVNDKSDKKHTYLKFIDAPKVTEFNANVQFKYFQYINLESYTGKLSVRASDFVKPEYLNIPKAKNLEFNNLEGNDNHNENNGKLRDLTGINGDSLTRLHHYESTNRVEHFAKTTFYHTTLNSLKEITLTVSQSQDKICSKLVNFNAPNLNFIGILNYDEVKNSGIFENVYLPKVKKLSLNGMTNNPNEQPEQTLINVNLDSLEKIVRVRAYGNNNDDILSDLDRPIAFNEGYNISARNAEVLYIKRTKSYEGLDLKSVIAPNIKEIIILNKLNFSNIDDIINFPNVEKVTISNTGITNIEALEGFKKGQIKKLDISDSKVKDIAPITKLGTNLREINTRGQKVDYVAYKEADVKTDKFNVKLVNPVSESTNTLFDKDKIKITNFKEGKEVGSNDNKSIKYGNLSNGAQASYDIETKTISWTGLSNDVKKLQFNFQVPYTLNGVNLVYSGVGTVDIKENSEMPEGEKEGIYITGSENKELKVNEIDKFNQDPTKDVVINKDTKLRAINVEDLRLEVYKKVGKKYEKVGYRDGNNGAFVQEKKDGIPVLAIEKSNETKKEITNLLYKVVKKSDVQKEKDEEVQVLAQETRRITLLNEAPTFENLPTYLTYISGDPKLDLRKDVKAIDAEDGDLTGKIQITDIDYGKIKKNVKSIQYVTYKVTDSDKNISETKVPVYINYKELPLSSDVKRAVCRATGKEFKEIITSEDVENITKLELQNSTDLTGIEFIPNLQELNLNGSNIRKLTKGIALPNLKYIWLEDANLEFLKDISLPNVERMAIHRAKNVEGFDIGNYPKLINFYASNVGGIRNSNVSNINSNLRVLDLRDNKFLTNLNLEYAPSIEELKLTGTNINLDNKQLEKLTNLKHLYVPETIQTFEQIDKTVFNRLKTISVPSGVTEIKDLKAENLENIVLNPNVVAFENNTLPKLVKVDVTKNLERFNGNKLESLQTINGLPSSENGARESKLREFNNNDLPLLNIPSGAGLVLASSVLESVSNNNLPSLTKLHIGWSDKFVMRNLKKVNNNKFKNLTDLTIIGNFGEYAYVQGNDVGENLQTVIFKGKFEVISGIKSNTLRNIWIDRAYHPIHIKMLSDIYAPNADKGDFKGSVQIDKFENVYLPKYSALFDGQGKPVELIKNSEFANFDAGKIRVFDGVTIHKSNDKINLNYKGIERFKAKTTGAEIWFVGNKVQNIDEIASYNTGGKVHLRGQTPDVTINMDEMKNSQERTGQTVVVPFDAILKATTTSNGSPTYQVTQEPTMPKGRSKGSTVEAKSSVDTSKKTITFNNVQDGMVAKVRVTGNVKTNTREHGYQLEQNSDKTIVTLTFKTNNSMPLQITGGEDKHIGIKQLDNPDSIIEQEVDTNKNNVKAKAEYTLPKREEILAGTEKIVPVTYTATNEEKTVTKTIYVKISNYFPEIKGIDAPLYLTNEKAKNTDAVLEQLKNGVTASDVEDEIYKKSKTDSLNYDMFLVKDGKETKITESTTISDFVDGENIVKYVTKDEDGNVTEKTRKVVLQENKYLIGLNDVEIFPKDVEAYNSTTNMNGVSLLGEYASKYDLEKEISEVGKNKGNVTITVPEPADTPLDDASQTSGKKEYIIKYKFKKKANTTYDNSLVGQIAGQRKVTVTNYKPIFIFEENEEGVKEYYTGTRFNLLDNVSVKDYEDDKNGTKLNIVTEQINTAQLQEGLHDITYNVIDSDGNMAQKVRQVRVIDKLDIKVDNKLSMATNNTKGLDILNGVTITKKGEKIENIEKDNFLQIKYTLKDVNNENAQSYVRAEDVKKALETKPNGKYILNYEISYKDKDIKEKVSIDREVIISGVEIKDAKLIEAINRELGRDANTELTQQDLESLTKLNVVGKGIKDITGLEVATNLQELDLSGNPITKADLSNLKNLKTLRLSGTNITESSNIKISKEASLDYLDLSLNSIDNIELELPEVKRLNLESNYALSAKITSPKIEKINLNSNRISNIDLNVGEHLVELSLKDNRIKDISSLKINELPHLESLNLENNQIEELINVNSESLKTLALNNNNIKNVKNISLNNLKNLGLGNNKISNIENVSFNSLEHLNLANNTIETIQNVSLNSLTSLNLANNKISDAKFVEKLTNLTSLNLANNKIENTQPIGNLVNLKTLDLSGNNISKINLQNLASLEELNIEKNKLSSLSNIEVETLKTLRIAENHIKSLENVKVPNLVRLTLPEDLSSLKGVDIPCVIGGRFTRNIEKIENCNLPGIRITNSKRLVSVKDSTVYDLPYMLKSNSKLREVENVVLTTNGDIALQNSVLKVFKNVKGENVTGRVDIGVTEVDKLEDLYFPKSSEIGIWSLKIKSIKNVETKSLFANDSKPLQKLVSIENLKLTDMQNNGKEDKKQFNIVFKDLSNLKVIDGLYIGGTQVTEFDLGSKLNPNPPKKARTKENAKNTLDVLTGLELPQVTTVKLNSVLSETSRLGEINVPSAKTLEIKDNKIKTLEQLKGLKAGSVTNLDLTNNQISDVSKLDEFVKNVKQNEGITETTVKLNGNKIENVSGLHDSQVKVEIGTQNIDNKRVFVETSGNTMTVEPAKLLNLEGKYNKITISDVSKQISTQEQVAGGTVESNNTANPKITWNNVSDGQSKQFKVTATNEASLHKGLPETYTANVTVVARDGSKPYLEFEEGKENIRLFAKEVPTFNLEDGLKVVQNQVTKAIPSGYSLKVKLNDKEITKLPEVEQDKDSVFNLTYELYSNGKDSSPIDTIQRTIISSNRLPKMDKFEGITIKQGKNGLIDTNALKELLKNAFFNVEKQAETEEQEPALIYATDLEDGKITNIFESEDEIAKAKLTKGKSNGIILPKILENMPTGINKLEYTVIDSDGNKTAQIREVFVQGNTPPVIKLEQGLELKLKEVATFNPQILVLSVKDAEENTFIEAKLTEESKKVIEEMKEYAKPTNSNKEEEKIFELTFEATDSDGNVSRASTSVKITNKKPVLVVKKENFETQKGLVLNLLNKVQTATDYEDGKAQLEIKVDGKIVENPTKFDTSSLNVKTVYNVEYTAKDSDKNVSQTEVLTLTVLENVKPTLVQPKPIKLTPYQVDDFNHTQEVYLKYGTEEVSAEGLKITPIKNLPQKDIPVGTQKEFETVYDKFYDKFGNIIEGFTRKITVSNFAPYIETEPIVIEERQPITTELLADKIHVKDEDEDIKESLKIVKTDNKLSTDNPSPGNYKVVVSVEDKDKNITEETLEIEVKKAQASSGSAQLTSKGSENKKESKEDKTNNKKENNKKEQLKQKISLPKIVKGNEKQFKDISKNRWSFDSIARMSSANIIVGNEKGDFNPKQETKRADMSIMLVKLLGLEDEAKAKKIENQFSDIREDKYYAKYVELAKELGLVSGVTESTFAPESSIKRQDAMIMIANVLKLVGIDAKEGKGIEKYKDTNKVSAYAKESIDYLTKLGIVQGDKNEIKPHDKITREEIVVIIDKAYSVIEKHQK